MLIIQVQLYTHTHFFFLSTCILDCILECQCDVDLRSQSPCIDFLAVCLRSLSCWRMNHHHSLRSGAHWSKFSSRMLLYNAAFVFYSILTSLPVPATDQWPHSMVPPPCQTYLTFTPKSSIFDTSDQEMLSNLVWDFSMYLYPNSMWAAWCLFIKQWLLYGYSTIQAWLVDSCRDGCSPLSTEKGWRWKMGGQV